MPENNELRDSLDLMMNLKRQAKELVEQSEEWEDVMVIINDLETKIKKTSKEINDDAKCQTFSWISIDITRQGLKA